MNPNLNDIPDDSLLKYEETIKYKLAKAEGRSVDIIGLILSGIAEEIDALRVARIRTARRHGDNSASISEKIVKAYKVLGDLVIEQRKLAISENFSFSSPYVVEIVRSMMDSVNNVLIELKVDENQKNVFFHRLTQKMNNLEEEVEKRVNNSKSLNPGN